MLKHACKPIASQIDAMYPRGKIYWVFGWPFQGCFWLWHNIALMKSSIYWRLSAFYFFFFAYIGAFIPFWGLYLKSLSFQPSQIGMLMSVMQFVGIVAPNVWGWVADRTGRRSTVVQALILTSLVIFCGFFFGTGFYWMLAVMAVISMCSGSLSLVEAITLSELRDETQRYGRIRFWGSVSFIAATMIVGRALDFLPIQSLLWICFGLLFVMTLSSFALPRNKTVHHEAAHEPVWQILKRPEVIALFAGCVLMVAAHAPLNIFYAIYLVDHGYSKTVAGLLIGVGVVAEIMVFIYQPKIFQRFSVRAVMLACFVVAVLRFPVIAWCADWIVLLVLAQCLHAFTFGGFHSASMAAIHRIFTGPHQARGQTLYTSISYGAGGTIGGLASGFVWEHVSPAATYLMASGFCLLGLLLVWWKFRLNENEATGKFTPEASSSAANMG